MKDILIMIIGIYLVLSGVVLTCGTLGAMLPDNTVCRTKMSRFEYILPAFRIGCWLGEKP